MRKNKGYLKDIRNTWHKKEPHNSRAKGENLTLEQYIDYINKCLDGRVETCKKEYEKISNKTTLVGEDLRKYCRDWMLWEVKFDNHWNLIPLDNALEMIEEERRKIIGRHLYSKWNGYQKRIVNKDNQKFVYNSGNGDSNKNTIRIPSLKRSNATWKRFYELFPFLKGKKTYRGIKLKKI